MQAVTGYILNGYTRAEIDKQLFSLNSGLIIIYLNS